MFSGEIGHNIVPGCRASIAVVGHESGEHQIGEKGDEVIIAAEAAGEKGPERADPAAGGVNGMPGSGADAQ